MEEKPCQSHGQPHFLLTSLCPSSVNIRLSSLCFSLFLGFLETRFIEPRLILNSLCSGTPLEPLTPLPLHLLKCLSLKVFTALPSL